jgi:hypothetical protein
MRTDGQADVTKLIVALPNCMKVLKNGVFWKEPASWCCLDKFLMDRLLGPSGYRSGLWLVRWSISAILRFMTNGDPKQCCSCVWESLLSLCWYWVNLPSTVKVCAYHKSTVPSHIRPKAVIFSVHTRRNGRGFPASVKISFPWKNISQFKHLKFTVQPNRQASRTLQMDKRYFENF